MSRRHLALPAVAAVALLAGLFPFALPAQAAGCSARTACDRALGVAITPPPGWFLVPRNKFPPHTLAFANGQQAENYTMRLVIQPFSVTSSPTDRQSVRTMASKLARSYRGTRITMRDTAVGGFPAVALRGVPGSGPAVTILVSNHNHIVMIVVPGTHTSADQRWALSHLRFIPRSGPFLPPVYGGR